jgi:addiction module RelE/StbE family toxin
MAEIKWTEPALERLREIADYIARDNADAANRLVGRIFEAVELLKQFPEFGRRVPEMTGSGYREVIVSPCRIIYRIENEIIAVIFVMRGEQQLKPDEITGSDT